MHRNADLVEAADQSQMQSSAAAAGTYPTKPEMRGRPNSGTAEQAFARPLRDSAAVSDNKVMDGDNVPMPVRVPKPRKPKDRSGEGDADITMSSTEDLTAAGEGEESNVPRKKRRRPRQTAGQDEGEALLAGAQPATDSTVVQPSPGEARRLKVHIKAQPGASVRIQNAPPAVAPKPAYRSKPHDTSAETDI